MTRWNDHHDDHDDALARAVARCLFDDPDLDWTTAFVAARRVLGVSVRGATPSHALVRRHLEAIEEVRLGAEGARRARQTRIARIVELLEFVRFVLQPIEIQIVGSPARGVIAGPLDVHVRILEGRSLQELFDQLESVGVKEVLPSTTVGPIGRFESVRFESDGVSCTLTRIPEAFRTSADARNLVTGKPITQVTLETFSRFFEEPSQGS